MAKAEADPERPSCCDSPSSAPGRQCPDGIIPLIRFGPNTIPEMRDTPGFTELLRNPDDRAVVDLLSIGLILGRALFSTPGVPAERVAALRKAFDVMVTDTADLAAAQKCRMTADDPMPGTELQALIAEAYGMPKEIIARAEAALTPQQ